MQAIRRVLAVKDRKIILNLPDDFQSDRVEIIVLPYTNREDSSADKPAGDWQKDFRSVSQWETEKDFGRVSSWPIETF